MTSLWQRWSNCGARRYRRASVSARQATPGANRPPKSVKAEHGVFAPDAQAPPSPHPQASCGRSCQYDGLRNMTQRAAHNRASRNDLASYDARTTPPSPLQALALETENSVLSSICAHHPCAMAMHIFSVSYHLFRMLSVVCHPQRPGRIANPKVNSVAPRNVDCTDSRQHPCQSCFWVGAQGPFLARSLKTIRAI